MRVILIEEQPDLLVFRLPNRADLFSVILLPIAICGFSIPIFLPIYAVFSGLAFYWDASTPAVFIVFYLVAAVCFSAFGFYWIDNVFKANFGQEFLRVTPNELTLELKVFGRSRPTTYPQSEVWQLRLLEKDQKRSFYRPSLDLDKGSYTLAFDYNAGTAFFGASISEKGAAEILEIICDKFPQYKPRDPATRHRWTPPRAS